MKALSPKNFIVLLVLIVATLCLMALTAKCQQVLPIGNPTALNLSKGGFRSDSVIQLPRKRAIWTWQDSIGRIYYEPSDSSVYYHAVSTWIKLLSTSTSGTVTSVSSGLYLTGTPNPITTTGTIKVDTATMFPAIRATISGGTGTVTSVTANPLSPIFTSTTATPTTTPVISFALSNAASHTFFGNFTGSSGAPSYSSPTLASADFANQGTTITLLHGNASGNPSWTSVVTNDIATNAVTYAKMQAISGNSLLLGSSASGTAVSEIILGTGISMTGSTISATGTGGTVTTVTANALSPLFTSTTATPTTTPVISYSLTNAAAHTFFGNFTGSTGSPSYSNPALASADFANQGTTTTLLHGNASGNPSFTQVQTADVASAAITYAKIQTETSSTIIGNPTTVNAAPAEITLGSGLAFSGTTLTATGSGGTVTSISAGTGITLSPSPITTTGSVTSNLSTGVSGGQTANGGTGAAETLTLTGSTTANTGNSTNPSIKLAGNALNGSSVAQVYTLIQPTVNASSTAGYELLKLSAIETATGSGSKYLVSAYAGASGTTLKFAVDNSAHMTIEGVTSTGATGTGKFVYDASPTLSGTPAAPTAAAGTSTTQIATTAFVGTGFMPIAGINHQSGTSYTLVAGDYGKIVEFSSNSAITLTIPASLTAPDATAHFACTVQQNGTGNITFTASSTTLHIWQGTKTSHQYGMSTIMFTNTTDTYDIQGDIQ